MKSSEVKRIRRAWSQYQTAQDRARGRLIGTVHELEAAGYRQAEIARAIGVSRQNLWNMLNYRSE